MRKTTTSTDVKRRYNEKNYTRISVQLPNEHVENFKRACEETNRSMRSVIDNFIVEYAEQHLRKE